MGGIWFDEERASVRSYSSATKGQKRLVRIEIEVSDPHELGSILRQLDQLHAPKVRPKKSRSSQLLLEDGRTR